MLYMVCHVLGSVKIKRILVRLYFIYVLVLFDILFSCNVIFKYIKNPLQTCLCKQFLGCDMHVMSINFTIMHAEMIVANHKSPFNLHSSE